MDSSEEPRGIFLVIDNKSFYATVECTMRGLDPLTTPLVVMSEAENTNGAGAGVIPNGQKALRHLQRQSSA